MTATVTAVLFAAGSFALFGAETWQAFFSSYDLVRHLIVEDAGVRYYAMQTTFAAVRLLGGSVATAYAAQATVGLLAALAVVWIWRQADVRFTFKASALATAALLASLYIMYYDLVLLGLPIAWLALEGERTGFLSFEKSLLVTAWLLPLACETIAEYTWIPLTPCIELLLMAAIVRRVRVAESQHREQRGESPSSSSSTPA